MPFPLAVKKASAYQAGASMLEALRRIKLSPEVHKHGFIPTKHSLPGHATTTLPTN